MHYLHTSISQMPLIPSNLGETYSLRSAAYLEALYYLNLERKEKPGGYQHYVFSLDLTERKTETGTETMSAESDLTPTEKGYRRVFTQDYGRYSYLPIGHPKLVEKGIATSAVLFQPMPQVLRRQIYVQPLKTAFPDEIYYVGIDDTTLKANIKAWILDASVADGYPPHLRVLRTQYTRSLSETEKASTAMEASDSDVIFADQMSQRWFQGKTTILMRGGEELGKLKETTTLNYDFTMVFHRSEGVILTKTDCLAFFQYRARLHHTHIPITANSNYKKGRFEHQWTRQMVGHPFIALVRAEDQASNATELRDFANKFIEAAQIDIISLTRIFYSKYNWDFMGDVEHFPPLLYVPAKWKAADWNKVKTDSGIRSGTITNIVESQKDVFDRARFTLHNPDELSLRFSFPWSRVTVVDSDDGSNLITSDKSKLYCDVIAMTENPPSSLDTIRVQYGVGGPIVLEIKVFLQKPIFKYVASHEVHAGTISAGVHTATASGIATRLPQVYDRIWRFGNANLRTQANLFVFWKPSTGAYTSFTSSQYQITTPHPSYAVVKYDREFTIPFEPYAGPYMSLDFLFMAKVWQESAFVNVYWVPLMENSGEYILPGLVGYRRNYILHQDLKYFNGYTSQHLKTLGAISDTFQHEICHALAQTYFTEAEGEKYFDHPDEFYSDLTKSVKFLFNYTGTFNRHSFFPGNLMHPGGGYSLITSRSNYTNARLTYEQVKLIQDKVS